jgi:type II secretory pathway pseudopilin PulG
MVDSNAIPKTTNGGDEEWATITLEQEQPNEEQSEKKAIMSSRRTTTLFFLGLVLVGILVAAITVPIVKNNNQQQQQSSSSSSAKVTSTAAAVGLEEHEGEEGNDDSYQGEWKLIRAYYGPELSEFPLPDNHTIIASFEKQQEDASAYRFGIKVANSMGTDIVLTGNKFEDGFDGVTIGPTIQSTMMMPPPELQPVEFELLGKGLPVVNKMIVVTTAENGQEKTLLMQGPTIELEFVPYVAPSVPDGTPTMVAPGTTGTTGAAKEAVSPVASTASTTTTDTGSGVVSYEPLWKGVSNEIGFYDASVVQGYANTADFQQDVMAVAKMMINLVVARNTGPNYYNNFYPYPSKGGMTDAIPVMAPAPGAAAPEANLPTVGNGVNDFGSNNQEDNVEEGDKIVSDGTRGMLLYVRLLLRVYMQREYITMRKCL